MAMATPVDYDHSRNLHTVEGARAALGLLFSKKIPRRLLDVGCGRGTWLSAALDLGVVTVYGIDGGGIDNAELMFPAERFCQHDLSQPFDLGERFDVALCLEVVEHLDPNNGPTLVGSLVKHADLIFFSAAAPAQTGQHHINCQWPAYWQRIFNDFGFVCDDWPRRKMWNVGEIEPWYRQNMFAARYAPELAGKEDTLLPTVHPDMLRRHAFDFFARERKACVAEIEAGLMPSSWYLSLLGKAAARKLKRRFTRPSRRTSDEFHATAPANGSGEQC